MRRFGKALGRTLLFLLVSITAIWLFAPREPVDRTISFDAAALPDDLDTYLLVAEQRYPDIVAGAAKRIIWAGAKGQKTATAIVYIHGFSATAEEIRPVPDEVARAFGANLFFTRLAGHGRGPAAMAEPRAGDWLNDFAEAIAIGRRLGDRVIVIATSTGATLAVLGASDQILVKNFAGLVLLSPNFALQAKSAAILDMPLARWWGPLVAGSQISSPPANAEQAKYWTTTYPTAALFAMAALMREARAVDTSTIQIPALFIYSPEDQVVDPTALGPVIGNWGGPVEISERHMQAGDDPLSHVVAGDIISPGQTEDVIDVITAWARGL